MDSDVMIRVHSICSGSTRILFAQSLSIPVLRLNFVSVKSFEVKSS